MTSLGSSRTFLHEDQLQKLQEVHERHQMHLENLKAPTTYGIFMAHLYGVFKCNEVFGLSSFAGLRLSPSSRCFLDGASTASADPFAKSSCLIPSQVSYYC